MRRENIPKPTIANESLHHVGNGNAVRTVKFATSKNLIFIEHVFPHRNIHKYTWSSPDGKTQSQIYHIILDRRWHSSILDVRSFSGADSDADNYVVLANVRERLAVSKQVAQKFDVKRFNLRKLNELEVRKEYHIKIKQV